MYVVELRRKDGSHVKTSPLFADRGHAERWGIRKVESIEYEEQNLFWKIIEADVE